MGVSDLRFSTLLHPTVGDRDGGNFEASTLGISEIPAPLFVSPSRKQFKEFCHAQGVSPRTVLDQLAALYVSSQGTILQGAEQQGSSHSIPPAPVPLPEETTSELLERIERHECDDREFVHAFEVLIHRVEALENRLGTPRDETKHTPRA